MLATKDVNLSQLAYEMGGASLRSIGPDAEGHVEIVASEDGGPTEGEIAAALEAHTADPEWTNPELVEMPVEVDPVTETLTNLAAKETLTDEELHEAVQTLLRAEADRRGIA